MSLDPANVRRSPARTVKIDGIGDVVVRRPRLADVALAPHNPYWWAACCSLPDGSPLFAPGTDIGALDAEVAGQLIEAVNAPRPTSPAPSDGSGASEALSRG